MFLMTLCYAVGTAEPFLVANLVTLIEIHLLLLIFLFDGNCNAWWSKGRIVGYIPHVSDRFCCHGVGELTQEV
jgi:hypothetical protein